MPFSLASSKRMRVPSVEPTPQALTGPLSAVWLPSTISVAVTPSSAAAGMAKAAAKRDVAASLVKFLMVISSCVFPLNRICFVLPVAAPSRQATRRAAPSAPRGARQSTKAAIRRSASADLLRACGIDAGCALPSSRRRVHVLDQVAVFLLHQAALEFHRRCQLLVLGSKELIDQAEFLHRLHAREFLVHRLH